MRVRVVASRLRGFVTRLHPAEGVPPRGAAHRREPANAARRASSSHWRGSPPCRGGWGSPPAVRSGRSRRPSAAPASRCPDRPPAPPRCGRGPPARRGRQTRSRPPPSEPRSRAVSQHRLASVRRREPDHVDQYSCRVLSAGSAGVVRSRRFSNRRRSGSLGLAARAFCVGSAIAECFIGDRVWSHDRC